MLLKLSFVFAICNVIEITEALHLPPPSNTKYAVAKNREELINIIRSLKYYENGNNNIDESDTELNDEEKEKKLQDILWLLKKNYNAQKHFEYLHNNRLHSTGRLYFIKNPEVLEEYKNHLNKIRRFSNFNSKHKYDQPNNLKNKLRNRRRDAMFRLGSSEQDSDDFDKKEEIEQEISNDIQEQSITPVAERPEKEEGQLLRKDFVEEYAELRETELHNKNLHNNFRSDYDFRREKKKWDERQDILDTVETERNKKNTYRNQPTHKKGIRHEVENVNWDKITTKKIPTSKFNKKKKTFMEPEHNIKSIYNRPKNEHIKRDFHSYGRTSIPIVGKRGIYDEK